MLKNSEIFCDWCIVKLHPTGEPFKVSEVKRINNITTVNRELLQLCDTCHKRGLPEDCAELDYDYSNPYKNPTKKQWRVYPSEVFKCDSVLVSKLERRFSIHPWFVPM